MYLPASFREDRLDVMQDLIRSYPLGSLITHGEQGLNASPVPFMIYPEESEQGILRAHMAKSNPHWKALGNVSECLIIFMGEQGYINPSWYQSKQTTHKVVPTWNYATVHVWGKPEIVEDGAWLQRQLNDLTNSHEQNRPQPWAMHDAPEDYIDAQMKAIIGIQIPITRIEGKWKMSQNRMEEDQLGVITGMQKTDDPHHNLPLVTEIKKQRY